jgi:hypothetical protein
VVNVTVQRREQTRHVGIRETNASEPPTTHRERSMTSKLGASSFPTISIAKTCLLAMWCPVYRWRESYSGLNTELGNSPGDVKRKPYKWDPTKGESSKAPGGDGSSFSGVEALVMRVERRGCLRSKKVTANRATGRSIYLRRRFAFARGHVHVWDEPCKSRDLRTVL